MIRQAGKFVARATCALGLLPAALHAQTTAATGTITGRVTDAASQQPLVGAAISVVGTTRGTLVNPDGTYRIAGVPAGTVQLRAQRIGYQASVRPVTLPSGGTVTADFALAATAVTLSEVVTTATGLQRRIELGNATAGIDAASEVANKPIANVGDLLQARAPGVQVLQGTSTGTGARVRIRGTSSLSLSNDPIYIIDGVRMTSNSGSSSIGVGGSVPSRVNDINPEEIESIEVVKGPSAATLYGTDAANGVILITTKRGRAGETRYNVYAEQGLIRDLNQYPTAYTAARNGAGARNSNARLCSNAQRSLGACTVDSLFAFNLYEDPETTPLGTGNRGQYGVQVSGGTEAVRFFTSGEYEEETGVLKIPAFDVRRLDSTGVNIREEWRRPNHLQRASVRANLNAAVSRQLDVALSTGFTQQDLRLPQGDNNTTGLQSSAYGGPGYRDNGIGANGFPLNGYRAFSPGDIFQETFNQRVNRFIGSASTNYRPAGWLATRANVGIDYTARQDTDLCRRGNCSAFGTAREGFKADNRANIYNYTADLAATATFDLDKNVNSRTTAGAQYVNYRFDLNQAFARNLPAGSPTLTGGAVPSVSEATTLSKTLGFFVEEQVSFRDRLFLTGALRTDQNSAFGTDFQAVYYPKASISWLLSEEEFFPRASWLNQFRLRAAYGAAGNQPGPNDALQFFGTTIVNVDRTDAPGVLFSTLGNPDLKPERSAETEAGFEARLFQDRLTLDFTYYSKVSRDALIARILPPSAGAGATTVLDNLGEVKNAGLEALVTARLVDRSAFGWDVSVNASTNANKLVSLGDVPPQIGAQIRQVPGYPLNGWWQRKISSYNDANNDTFITPDEIVVDSLDTFIGYSQPRHEISVTNGFDLFRRQLRISALVDYKGGYIAQNDTERIRCQNRNNCSGLSNPEASLFEKARVVALRDDPSRTQAGYLEDGAFVRFRELSLTYTAPNSVAARLFRGNSASVTLAGRNLGKITDFTGIDPESTYGSGDIQNNFQTSPPPTYFTLRLNVGF